jgi:hypothetical protein
MPTILLYFFLAIAVLGAVVLAVPDETSAPPSNPHDVMMQLPR